MNMPNLEKRRAGDDDFPKKPVLESTTTPLASSLVPNPQQRRHWAKKYRTEIAASTGSIIGTFAAVCGCLELNVETKSS